MKIITSIHNVKPRIDDPTVKRLVQEFLDKCDPGTVITITMEVKE